MNSIYLKRRIIKVGEPMYYMGIDLGSRSLKAVCLNENKEIIYKDTVFHSGAIHEALKELLSDVDGSLGLASCIGWGSAGKGCEILEELDAHYLKIEDVPASCLGASLLCENARSIIHIGATDSLFITSSSDEDAPAWDSTPIFSMNESCASGTGSFFEDQMHRLGMSIEQYNDVVKGASSIPRISGRCSVFAKTDIIHRQQEGVGIKDILLGLCYSMVKSFKATIVRSTKFQKPVALSGGVIANDGVIQAVLDTFKLDKSELLCDLDNVYMQAVGACLYAIDNYDASLYISSQSLMEHIDALEIECDVPREKRLPQTSLETHLGYVIQSDALEKEGRVDCVLGIDVGSTSTNLVILDLEGRLLDAQYLRTSSDAKIAIGEGFKKLKSLYGNKLNILGVSTTGSGRYLIGKYIGADLIRDEITAQAKAACAADSKVDTVFEIGGQDSKYISIDNLGVVDFQMNKICAAGTGSFIEEQAKKLDIKLSDYGKLALSSSSPVDLGERCTVFVESSITSALAKGVAKSDIAAGLCLSVVKNYLHRVVGTKPVGEHVVLQGGVAYNPAVVSAFKSYLGDRLHVSPWFAVSGAVGAALLVLEDLPQNTSFRGLDLMRPEVEVNKSRQAKIKENTEFFDRLDDLFLEGYDPVLDPDKKTVGIPRCLIMHKLFPMANAFFTKLGFNVVLSQESDEEIVELSNQLAQGETCYPVKLIHGHMEKLARANVDYIFMPSAHTIKHPGSNVLHNYACPFMQSAPKLVARELNLEQRGIKLLNLMLDMDFGQSALANALLDVGSSLGFDEKQTSLAMLAGGFAVREFTRKTEELGEELLSSLKEDEKVLVLVTRNYGIVDPMLNMGIPQALLDRGQKVITISHLHAHDLDISNEYPGLYWPFGQHIISGAKIIKEDPRLFAVYLTNHACGPDTQMLHLFDREMGQKPYLHIEIDEHSSQVGVVTRIEAFLNSLDNYKQKPEVKSLTPATYNAAHRRISWKHPVYIPQVTKNMSLLKNLLYLKAKRDVSSSFEPKIHTVYLDEKIINIGKSEAVTKEYLSFTALVGMCLDIAQTEDRECEVVLCSGQGCDADGMYARVISSILEQRGLGHVKIIAPYLEQLPWTMLQEDFTELFNACLAFDIVSSAPKKIRNEVYGLACNMLDDFDKLLELAQIVGSYTKDTNVSQLGVVGELLCVLSQGITADILQSLETKGYRLNKMPLSEYLLFMWQDMCHEDMKSNEGKNHISVDTSSHSHASSHTSDTCGVQITIGEDMGVSYASKTRVIEELIEKMSKVSEALGAYSPFSSDFNNLVTVADEKIDMFNGSNGRYRLSKLYDLTATSDGVITLSSMYENTDTILRLMEDTDSLGGCSVCHLEFEGGLRSDLEEKLNSFLFYV